MLPPVEPSVYTSIAFTDRLVDEGIDPSVGSVGDARIKRMVYPPGMRWSTDLKPLAGTELCEHAHAGFLAQGQQIDERLAARA